MADMQPSTSKAGNAPIKRQGQTYSGQHGSQPFAKRRGATPPKNLDA
jgi:hypothetical protein